MKLDSSLIFFFKKKKSGARHVVVEVLSFSLLISLISAHISCLVWFRWIYFTVSNESERKKTELDEYLAIETLDCGIMAERYLAKAEAMNTEIIECVYICVMCGHVWHSVHHHIHLMYTNLSLSNIPLHTSSCILAYTQPCTSPYHPVHRIFNNGVHIPVHYCGHCLSHPLPP